MKRKMDVEADIVKEVIKHSCLSQWELARLFANHATTCESTLFQVLGSLTFHPELICLKKTNCNECSGQFCHLFLKGGNNSFQHTVSEVELRLILQSAASFIPKDVSHEIHKNICKILEDPESTNDWTSNCLDGLLNALNLKPLETSLILKQILSVVQQNSQLEVSLVQLYFECLQQSFNKLKATQLRENVEIEERLRSRTLSLLNLIPEKKLDIFSANINLFELCFEFVDEKLFSKKEIYATFLGQDKPTILKLYESKEDVLSFRAVEWDPVTRGTLYGGILSNGNIQFDELFLQMLKTKEHLLDGIVKSSVDHILNGRVETVLEHFSDVWFSRLLPLVICSAWQQCNTDREADNVFRVLKAMNLEANDDLVKNLVNLMLSNLAFADWCLDKYRDQCTVMDNSEILNKRRNFFSYLQINSPLRTVHKFVGLRNIQPAEILNLLEGKANQKNVENQSHATLFRGYLVLSLVMDAVYYSNQLDLFSKQCSSLTTDEEDIIFSESAALKRSFETEGYQHAYEEFVTKNLEKAKLQLEGVTSVALKVELLENIFSLIFLTHNDLQTPNVTLDTSDEGYIGIDVNSVDEIRDFRLAKKDHYKTFSNFNGDNRSRSGSCQGSSSSGSSGGNYKLGFLCNETILKDLLNWLNDTFVETKSLVYQEYGLQRVEQNGKKENNSGDCISSVGPSDIQKRISKLWFYIQEAQWRYELLSNEILPDIKTAPENGKTKNTEKHVSFFLNGKHKRKKKKKTNKSILTSNNKALYEGIFHRMLASPETLLRYSLLQRNLKQADQVIQLFNLQNTHDGEEVIFSLKFMDLVLKLSSRKPELSLKRNHNSVLSQASASLESATEIDTVNKHFEDFPNPKLQEITELSVLAEVSNSQPISFLLTESKELDLAVLADVAFSFSFSIERIESILSLGLRRSKQNQSTSQSKVKKQINLKGIVCFTKQMHEFIMEVITNFKAEGDFYSPCYSFQRTRLKLFLCLGSLEAKTMRKNLELWKTFNYQCELLAKMLTKEEETQVTMLNEDGKEGRDSDLLHSAFFRLTKFDTQELSSSFNVKKESALSIKYLEALYQHVKEVANVLVKCSKDWILCKSYFSVLNQSPSVILSNLVMENSVPLKELENFANQMHLNLVHVITQTCCPAISNCVIAEVEPQIISDRLNLEIDSKLSSQDPETISQELLNQILEIIQEHGNSEFNLKRALFLCGHSEVGNWMENCSILSSVDLKLLPTQEAKLAFFINVTNLLWLHAVFSDMRQNLEHYVITNEDFVSSKPCSALLSPYLCERMVKQCQVEYQIGQLGYVSLYLLKYWLLIKDSTSPKFLENSPLKQAEHFFDGSATMDYLPNIEPRLIFALNESFVSSPILRVFNSESIRSQLDEAMFEYLSNNIEVDVVSEKVHLPQLLDWHYKVFASDDPKHSAPYEGLLSFISSNVNSELKTKIESLLEMHFVNENNDDGIRDNGHLKSLPFTVEIVPFDCNFGVNLQHPKKAKPLSTSCLSISLQEKLNGFKLPDHVSQFVSSRCSLVSDLLNVVNEISTCEDLQYYSQPEYFTEQRCRYPLCQQLLCGRTIEFLRGHTDLEHSWLQAYLTPKPSSAFCWNQVQACVAAQKLRLALQHLEDCNVVETPADIMLFKDLLLLHFASQHPSLKFPDPWCYALRISNDEYRVKAVNSCLKFWPDQACLETLQSCLYSVDAKLYPDLHKSLKLKLEQMIGYKKAVRLLNKNESFLSKISTWQQVKTLAETNIEAFIDGLSSQPKLLVECVKFHSLPQNLTMIVTELHILCLLDENPPKLELANQMLTSFDETERESLLGNLMKKSEECSLDGRLFLVNSFLSLYPSHDSVDSLKKLRIGLKMLCCISFGEQMNYKTLVKDPIFLFEQLLMNNELETATKALNFVYADSESDTVLCREMINECIEKYARDALELAVIDDLPETSDVVSVHSAGLLGDQFVMPAKTPSKTEWIPDNAVTTCMVCGVEQFSMFLRRHHCRRCGRVVSANCSQNSLVLAGYNNMPVRVCDHCYEQTTRTSYFSQSAPSSVEKTYSNSPVRQALRQRSSTLNSFKIVPWLLSDDESDRKAIREEFCYEQAPSIPLCLSILKLHDNPERCAKYILTLSDYLFTAITPRSSGKVNSEVDYSLVLSMMRTLLLSAKVKFLEAKNYDGVEYYEIYNSRLDLVNMLIKNNCAHLIPEGGITSNEVVRRIRDRLMEEERMAISLSGDDSKFDSNFETKKDRRQHSLALEVSTKFGLDVASVFASWGMLCLKVGDWISARDKFSHCLQVPKDLSEVQQESPLLKEILATLETSSKGELKVGNILNSLSSLKSIQNGTLKLNGNVEQNHTSIEECVYYLIKYGTHMSVVSFSQKNGMFTEALKYILDKSCDSDIFINGLFMPSVKVAQMGVLLRQMQSHDATLEKWWPFLMATCFYLHQKNLFHVLHKVQVFMGDYIRSAMTSIKFYQAPANDYTILFDRLYHLNNAKHDFERYLNNVTGVVNPKKKVLRQPPQMVQGHLETVSLQVEVTKFFHFCEANNILNLNLEEIEREIVTNFPKEPKPLCPPTLFDSRTRKTALAVVLLLLGLVELQGLNYGIKVIQDHQLDGDRICAILGQYVVKLNRVCDVANLVNYLRQSPMKDKINCDEMVQSCVENLAHIQGKSREIETLIKLLNSDISKINCYIMCSKLKSAYLLAIRLERIYDVKRIQNAAKECSQDSVASICEKWLQHKERSAQ